MDDQTRQWFEEEAARTRQALGLPLRPDHWTPERVLAKACEFEGRTMNCQQFCKETGVPRSRVYAFFSGWTELCELSGITPKTGGREKLSSDDIGRDILAVWRRIGRFPTGAEYSRLGRTSVSNVHVRLGKWSDVRAAFTRRFPHGPPPPSP